MNGIVYLCGFKPIIQESLPESVYVMGTELQTFLLLSRGAVSTDATGAIAPVNF